MKKIFFFLFFLCLIFSTSSAKAASQWQQLGNPISDDTIGATSIVVDSHDVVYVAYTEYYQEDSFTKDKIIVKKYENDVWTTFGDFHHFDVFDNPQLKVNSDNEIYLAYLASDYTSTGGAGIIHLFVEKWAGNGWQQIGGTAVGGITTSTEFPEDPIFDIGPDDTLYLAYKNSGSDSEADGDGNVLKILKYTGDFSSDNDAQANDGWEYVYSSDPSLVNVGKFSFSVGSDNELYVAYWLNLGVSTSSLNGKMFAYRLDTNGWTSLLSTLYDASENIYLKANDNGFYLYFRTGENDNRIYHYTNSSSSWQLITSSQEFVNDEYNYKYLVNSQPFVIDSDGNLNIVYGNTEASLQDWDNPWGSATVMKYDNGNWDYVGSKRFSQQSSMYFSIGAASSGELYVICRDGGDNEEKATVYKFAEADSVTEPTDTSSDNSQGSNVAENSGEYGASPVTGQQEAISEISTGQFIRSYSFSGIYYIDEDMVRHPFWDANSFFTYADSWNDVVWVTDATLPTMTLGSPMLPKENVVLVKIQSDPKVYAIDSDNTLRWVPSEIIANTLYGTGWADYVIDLEATIFARYSVGENMTGSENINGSIMKTRFELVDTP